jgi:hypothetical protein
MKDLNKNKNLVMSQRRREPNRYCWQQAQQEAVDNSK